MRYRFYIVFNKILIILSIIIFDRGALYATDYLHLAYHPIVKEVSHETGLDANIIKAVIKIESNWDPQAESNAGALGLMQVMPESAEEVGISASDLYDPYSNMLAGSRYLLKMYEKFPNWGEAFAAYYLGPAKLEKRAISQKNWRGLAKYLRRIKKHLHNYRKDSAQIDNNHYQ